MTTSGTTVFAMTRTEIITAAVRKLGRLASGQSLSTQQLTDGQFALNGVLALLQTKGMPLWARAETTFPLTATGTYTIGPSLTINTPAPLKIYQAFAVTTSTSYGTEMEIVSIYDLTLNILSSTGPLPIQLAYQPLIDTGKISIWPVPDTTAIADVQIKIIYQRPLEMNTTGTETIDVPKEYHQPLIYTLATVLAPEWGVPLQDRQALKAEAAEYMAMVDSFGMEEGSLYFTARRS